MTKTEAVILFDGVCNLCNTGINFIIDNDEKGYFKFASLQSPEAHVYMSTCAKEGSEISNMSNYDVLSSLILYENGQCFRKSTAVLHIARKLRGAWPVLFVFKLIPTPIRDAAYDWVAQNRYRWFGKQDACRIPTPDLRARFLDNLSSSAT